MISNYLTLCDAVDRLIILGYHQYNQYIRDQNVSSTMSAIPTFFLNIVVQIIESDFKSIFYFEYILYERSLDTPHSSLWDRQCQILMSQPIAIIILGTPVTQSVDSAAILQSGTGSKVKFVRLPQTSLGGTYFRILKILFCTLCYYPRSCGRLVSRMEEDLNFPVCHGSGINLEL